MVRVPLAFRGIAVLLLAASAAVGQSPEPPGDLLLEPFGSSSPDFLRQFSNETHHPLLHLMVDGEMTSFDASAPQEASKIKPTPQKSETPAATESSDDTLVEGSDCDGCQFGMTCPMAPTMLPFACPPPPPPCCCRKCQRRCSHKHCGGGGYGGGYGSGPGYGNQGFNGSMCPAWCFYGAPLAPCQKSCGHFGRHKQCCGNYGCGNPYGGGYGGGGYGGGGYGGGGYGGGWGMMDGVGLNDGGFCGGCTPCWLPPPPCCCRKCHRSHHNRCCGNQGYGNPYGYGYGGGYMAGAYNGGCMPYMAPQQCCCRKCQRQRCSHGCGYASGGYGGGYQGMGCGYEGCMNPNYGYGGGCGRHHRGGFFHRHHCCQQPTPYPYCPMMMPCMGMGMGMGMDMGMGMESFGGDCAFGGVMGGDSFVCEMSN